MVLQQAPAQAIVWGYAPKCDSKLTVTFDQKAIEPTTTDSKLFWNANAHLYKVCIVPIGVI